MKILLILFLLGLSTGCNRQKLENQKLIAAWQGKEIKFPQGMVAKLYGQDTVWTDWQKKKYKILNYVDTSGCTECQLRLYSWMMMKKETEEAGLDVVYLFATYVKDYHELGILQKANLFDTPFLYDYNGILDSLNHFPKQNFFKTFLLDCNNKVVLVGNPVSNAGLWDLYKKQISKSMNK